ncbi:hypothetical protein QE152_g37362 [Popillia japonica]|uniref:Uncharacterized protein n=1 Tax=Popillia japonica TaxID=7064 RepID=A0AAW1I9W0_POPJA
MAIQASNQDVQVKTKSNEDIIHIRNIDGDINKDEIRDAIAKSVGSAKVDSIKVSKYPLGQTRVVVSTPQSPYRRNGPGA